jgi:hypothetical protein
MNIVLNFWPSSKTESIKNQNKQIKINSLFLEAIKPAVMSMNENTWAKEGRLWPIIPNRLGRVL